MKQQQQYHFGPGNHNINLFSSSRAGKVGNDFDDSDDEDGEEGLDEREPEKAFCPDNQKLLAKALQLGTSSNELDFNQLLQSIQEQQVKEQAKLAGSPQKAAD